MGRGIGLGIGLGGGASWSPSLLGSSLKLWLHAERGVVPGATFTWQDQSGNGFHFTQSTATRQPTVGTLNGRAAVAFDGGDALSSAATIVAAGMHTIVVVCQAATSGDPHLFDSHFGRLELHHYKATNGGNVSYRAEDTLTRGSVLGTANAQALIFQLDSLTVSSIYRDGIELGQYSYYATAIAGGTTIGNGFDEMGGPLNGKIRELFVVSPAISRGTLPLVHNYLRAGSGTP